MTTDDPIPFEGEEQESTLIGPLQVQIGDGEFTVQFPKKKIKDIFVIAFVLFIVALLYIHYEWRNSLPLLIEEYRLPALILVSSCCLVIALIALLYLTKHLRDVCRTSSLRIYGKSIRVEETLWEKTRVVVVGLDEIVDIEVRPSIETAQVKRWIPEWVLAFDKRNESIEVGHGCSQKQLNRIHSIVCEMFIKATAGREFQG